MRQIVTSAFGIFLAAAVCVAQVDQIRQAEQKLIDARRTGVGIGALHSDDYLDVIPPGTTRTAKAIASSAAAPKYGGHPDIQVRMFGNAALVTGVIDAASGGWP
jgi:hypothetical protein